MPTHGNVASQSLGPQPMNLATVDILTSFPQTIECLTLSKVELSPWSWSRCVGITVHTLRPSETLFVNSAQTSGQWPWGEGRPHSCLLSLGIFAFHLSSAKDFFVLDLIAGFEQWVLREKIRPKPEGRMFRSLILLSKVTTGWWVPVDLLPTNPPVSSFILVASVNSSNKVLRPLLIDLETTILWCSTLYPSISQSSFMGPHWSHCLFLGETLIHRIVSQKYEAHYTYRCTLLCHYLGYWKNFLSYCQIFLCNILWMVKCVFMYV